MRRRLSRRESLALPLLRTEAATDLVRILDAVIEEVRPRGIILEMLVNDYAYFVWEICRLRRWKAAIIENAFYSALRAILRLVLHSPLTWGFKFEGGEGDQPETPDTLAQKWFIDDAIKQQILELLGDLNLDETAIEAEAMRMSSDDLEVLDRMLASAESRRDKTLRAITEYHGNFALQLRKAANQIIEAQVIEVEKPCTRSDSTAA
jgi:hypothetical protein